MKEKFLALFDKLKNLVLKPKEAWAVIANEEMSVDYLLKDVLLIAAILSAVGQFIGRWLVGTPIPSLMGGGVIKLTFFESLIASVLTVALQIVGIWAFAKVLNYLAPRFGAVADENRSLKLAVFTTAPVLFAGIVNIIPALGIIVSLMGLYSLYLLYVGAPVLMQSPKNKALPYCIVSIVSIAVIMIIISIVTAPLMRTFGGY
ncbi:YIP1 family protein [bacterium]|nr:YIP1 family protein [bacterium]